MNHYSFYLFWAGEVQSFCLVFSMEGNIIKNWYLFISVNKPGKLSDSVELSLAVGNARNLKCLLDCQTASEYLIDIKFIFSYARGRR